MDNNGKAMVVAPTINVLSDISMKTAGTKTLRVHEKFVCSYDDCDKVFSKLNRLIQHERVHTGERPFKCTYENCIKSYARNSHLKRHVKQTHVKIRTPGDVVICEENGCYRNFVSEDSLKKHLRVVHGLNGDNNNNDDNKYYCPVDGCKASFSKRFQLRHHDYQEHKRSTLFQCMECQKKFVSHSKLKRHSKTHEGYKCAACSEVFSKWSLLRRHKSQDHKEIIACKFCNMKFKSNSKLSTHLSIHQQKQQHQININLISDDDDNETETDCYSFKLSDGDNDDDDDVKVENPGELESNKESKINMNISNMPSGNGNSISNNNNDNSHDDFKNESETVQMEVAKNPVISLHKAFRCNMDGCARSYTTRYNLKTHKRICHLENYNNNKSNINDNNSNSSQMCQPLFICSVEGCGMSLSTKQKLQLHSIMHTDQYISMKNARKLKRNKHPKSNHNQSKQDNLSALVNLHKRITLSEKPAEILDGEDQMKKKQRRLNLKVWANYDPRGLICQKRSSARHYDQKRSHKS
ncbi:hypothetical protein HELRODRAFT_168687 [Helobdella robusta]|uniref:C2H2-type domain-containing protein n=1 Tax=Helobdella robusta TaxID=6412 RepID=T1F0V1_HELRO|nr:hypothetical protein HELRODRAFT_168687 [Helobdella robusta]ESO08781.1 hypothetical protein HELRODRAFT_168687 [Helobdella robusta]